MSAPMLSLVPPQGMAPPVAAPVEPPPPLQGKELEDSAREELCRSLNLDVKVHAPTWRVVLFSGRRITFQIPKAPQASLDLLGQIKPPESLPKDHVGITAVSLGEGLQKARPEGLTPKSITALPTLPASRDSVSAWMRRVFLVTAGPECLPLLVASGYLLPSDVATFEETYPDGLDAQRKDAVEAAMAVTAASHRTGHGAELPTWLNAQLMTLMDEKSPDSYFQDIYKQQSAGPASPQGGGGALGGKATKLATQAAPDTIRGTL